MVLSRPCHPDDQFTTSILRHWCIKHDDLLAEHIKSLLIKNNSLPRKRQRWAAAGGSAGPGCCEGSCGTSPSPPPFGPGRCRCPPTHG